MRGCSRNPRSAPLPDPASLAVASAAMPAAPVMATETPMLCENVANMVLVIDMVLGADAILVAMIPAMVPAVEAVMV
jgi:hypothetical protein